MLLHLFYGLCLVVPILINLAICFYSYLWHNRFKLAMTKELEQLRNQQAGR